jgi:hypothetical protein
MVLISEHVHPLSLDFRNQRRVVLLRDTKKLSWPKIRVQVKNLKGRRPSSFRFVRFRVVLFRVPFRRIPLLVRFISCRFRFALQRPLSKRVWNLVVFVSLPARFVFDACSFLAFRFVRVVFGAKLSEGGPLSKLHSAVNKV